MASDSEDESFAAGSDEGEDDESVDGGDLSGSDAEVRPHSQALKPTILR